MATATPAGAHAVGGRADLPLPLWMFAYGAAGVLLVSFAALAVFWPTAKLGVGPEAGAGALGGGRDGLGGARALRLLGVALFALVLAAAFWGPGEGLPNLALPAVYITFWVGLTFTSALVGDVWRALNPFPTLAAAARFGLDRIKPNRVPAPRAYRLGHWPAAALLFGFVWVELVDPYRGDPRHLGALIVVYTLVVVAGAARWGRPWLRQGEAFAALFGTLAHMAPLYFEGGRLRVRPPVVGLAAMTPVSGTAALVMTALGSTSFDGLSRTSLWLDTTADLDVWPLAVVSTIGMIGMIAVVYVAYEAAMRLASRLLVSGGRVEESAAAPEVLGRAFVHSLVPIVAGYAVAHYFSYLMLEGQASLTLVSDPFGRGWDLLGTAHRSIDYGLVSPRLVSWVQMAAIVGGHVAGVVLAHDRALALFPGKDATRSQYPLLGAMVLFTVGGLYLLFSS